MGDTTSNESEFTPRASSPLVHPSDVPGTSLLGVPFSGTGFGGWKRSIIVSISARNKIAFIDGNLPRPPINSPECKQWDRVNDMVISWLTSSLSPEIAESVQYSETAESIWRQLNTRYGTFNGTKKFEIKRELAFTCQGALDIASFFNKLKKFWDELTVMSSNHAKNYNCAAKPGLEQEEEENRVHQFLMGLNETYVNVRSNILLMNPLPSLDNVYNILLQDEKQRQVIPTTHFSSDMASLHASANNKPPSQPNLNKQYNQRLNFDHSNQRMNLGQHKGSLFCKYCKKNNHTIETCHKLHGFPQNFKFTKGRKYGTAANIESSASGVRDALLLLDLLTNHMGSANFAGNISTQPLPDCDSFAACILSSAVRSVWIVDSGATDHMTSIKDFLFDIKPLPVPYLVSLPNGYKVKDPSRNKFLELGRVHHGLYKLLPLTTSSSSTSSHTNVLPKLNCISISYLVANVLSMHSSPASSLNDTTSVVNSSPLNNNVPIVSDSTTSTLSCVNSDVSCMNSVNVVTSSDILWHHRLSHIPFAKMKAIPAISPNISSKQSFICPICPLARQSRLPFPDNSPYSIPSPLPSSPSPIISDPSGPSAVDVSLPPSFTPSSPISASSPISTPISPPSSFSFSPQSDSSPAQSSPSLISSSPAAPRKSTRTHSLPSHLQDYVVSLPPSFCSSTNTTTDAPTTAVEPHSYHQAALSPAWQEAMKKEFEALEANHA
ncbi:PREDICTED: uncharacterized protein LOC109215314 [Nicotiana attenuata]|uniref:uncharacterized protein LOC109215314 n=1 Tax=Nicotiana attenuata TaxID=49451 RepID=UPI000905B4A8|nr:PREDICTED: uncharacterized protein LOC109215314 [Nicotiana attenuata]